MTPVSHMAKPGMDEISMEQAHYRWWDGPLCGCLVILAVLISFPFAEMGFSDDFSYIKTAHDFARTGHLIYNGWAAPMQGWQAVWGALFIKIFGFSFSAVRWSMFPVAFATIWLWFAILIRFGLSRRNAYFGTLLFGWSPLFIPLASSFMTDMTCAFGIILCLYLCQRAVAAKTDTATIGWLAAATTTNIIGGTARQIAWLGVLVMIPSTAWLLRKRRGVLLAGFILWCLAGASILGFVHWLNQQPYILPEGVSLKPGTPLSFVILRVGLDFVKEFLYLSLLVVPVLMAWLVRMKRIRFAAFLFILLVAFAFQFYSLKTHRDFHMLPWVPDLLGDLGLSPRFNWMLGTAPVLLGSKSRYVLSYILMVIAAVCAFDLFRGRMFSLRQSTATWLNADPNQSSSYEFWLLVPFVVAYQLLLIPRSVDAALLDRYMFDLLPFIIFWVLKIYQERYSQALPAISYLALAAIAVFSVGGTHDWYALNRARLQVASILLKSGVPETQMQLGLDYDGWTQFKYFPAIATPDARVPEWFLNSAPPPNLPDACVIWSWKMTPAIHPNYFAALSPMPCLASSRFGTVEYHAWLPPFHRKIYIQERP